MAGVIEFGTDEGRRVRRVSIDGRDVTADCFKFDAAAGWVELYDRDARGRRLVVRGHGGGERVHSYKLWGKVDAEWR